MLHLLRSLVPLSVALVAVAPVAHADDTPRTWTLKPAAATAPDDRAYLVHESEPGDVIDDHVAVTNFSAEPLTLDLYASDAFTTEGGGFDLLARGEVPVDIGAWIALDESSVSLGAGETRIIGVHITVPANATPGDHAGGIVAALSTPATDAAGNQVTVEHRVGTRVHLRVDGPLVPSLELSGLTSSYRGTANPIGGGSVELHYTVRNTGNVRLSARQLVEVSAPAGIVLRRVRLDDLPELLPGDSVDRIATVGGVAPGFLLGTQLRLEPYDATGTVTVEAAVATSSSWAIPWTQSAIAGVAGAAVIARRRMRRRRPAAVRVGSATT